MADASGSALEKGHEEVTQEATVTVSVAVWQRLRDLAKLGEQVEAGAYKPSRELDAALDKQSELRQELDQARRQIKVLKASGDRQAQELSTELLERLRDMQQTMEATHPQAQPQPHQLA